MQSGLPDCCGVALGFDRLVMLVTDANDITEVIAFPFDRAWCEAAEFHNFTIFVCYVSVPAPD